MPEQTLEEPRLLLDRTHEHHRLFSQLDEAIRNDPDRVLITLSHLGEIGVEGAQPHGPASAEDASTFRYIFDQRLDHELEFDDATEDFLARDPEQLALIERMHNQRARVKGKYEKVTVDDNPGALRYRDIIRRRRIAVLTLRRLEWQKSQPTQTPPIPRQAGSPTESRLDLVA